MADTPEDKLRFEHAWNEIKLLQDSTMRVWQMHMNYYTWFFGINVLAMGWILTSDKVNKSLIPPFALFISLIIVLSIGAGICMGWFYFRLIERARRISVPGISEGIDIRSAFGERIGRFAIYSMPLSFVGTLVVWAIICMIVTGEATAPNASSSGAAPR